MSIGADVLESCEVNGYTIQIVADEAGDGHANPREGDNLGVMVANGHRRYTLGDADFACCIPEYNHAVEAMAHFAREGDLGRFIEWAETELGATVVLPLWLLDHSGLTMRTGPFREDPGGWDSGIVGFIFDTTRTREQTGAPLTSIEQQLNGEVEAYSKYLGDEVYGYQILDPCGDIVESCWGFLGSDHVMAEAVCAANDLKTPQWVVLTGDLTTGITAHGPYPDGQDAHADYPTGTVMLLSPPPERTYRLVAGPENANGHVTTGQTFSFSLTRPTLRAYLARGWTRA